ncbi:MAG: isoleucine--tRNA ligase [Spirochaetaceae bacterium]|jgi:isoleucyl-tRNA synthetase|nr:isoleucine--tRNA ligase [Spirochaetaceae bacterium]
MFNAVNTKVSFPKLEEEILEFWRKNDVFKKSIDQRKASGSDGSNSSYVFYDGPPFANGLPHFGHFVPSTIKDIISRYQTMRGKRVERRFGWDCHGLPVENLIEKELGLNSKTSIEAYGIARFNEACRASVLRYASEWRRIITRLGRWVDFDNDYKTMENPYMESIWWVMKSLWERGLLYEGHYILPYCPRCSTVLSNHELNLGGYKDVHDPAITVQFKIITKKNRSNLPFSGDSFFLAWTTTPWTLTSNLALTVGPDIDYVIVQDGEKRFVLAQARLSAYYKEAGDYSILWKGKGTELTGIQYEPLFPYFEQARANNAFRVYSADFVSTEDGTGIVHTAPGFGEDDARALQGTGVPVICPVDAECKFTSAVPDYAGRFVKDCDKEIIERLKTEGKLVKRDQILHAYPHCWRCSSPLIYRAVESWFVNVQKIKQDILEANKQIHWIPEHIKEGRFGKWLEGAKDWAISRNRYWGNPLPIWKCPDCGKTICVGSIAELKELSGKEPHDLHKHFVDDITIPCAKTGENCSGVMRRIPEVLDCWFESGAMPYAQNHYPFENKTVFENNFPADFINEGLDQTRGWFYTLTILSAALFKKPAFKNCIVSGLVLAQDGKKMSKSLRNYTDPMEVVNTFSADALRLFLVNGAVVKAEDLRYTDEGVRDVLKSIILPLWNAYSFFVTYANIDGARVQETARIPENPLDKWILSASQTLISQVSSALDAYDLSRAVSPLVTFIDSLNNWYIRRSRRRFWKTENDADKKEAYNVLYTVLKTLIAAAAPFMPFITEAIYQNLKQKDDPLSIHLCDFPRARKDFIDAKLEFKMETVQKAVSIGRSLRSQENIKVRQPLALVKIVTRNTEAKTALVEMEDSIREELNVKEVVFSSNEEDLVDYQAKANFRVLGKELGPLMKAAAEKIEAFKREEITAVLEGAALQLEIDGKTVEITAEKLEIKRKEKSGLKVLNQGDITVALDATITAELAREGDVRDLIRGVQNMRKEAGLNVSDRIKLYLFGSPRLKEALREKESLISGETLAVTIEWGEKSGQRPIALENENWLVSLEKA